MRKQHFQRAQTSVLDEIIVDNFAGGGGASTGMELATGRPVEIAINHDPAAILMHKTNHPYTEHLQASVWDVNPVEVCRGRPVGLAWFSPDCKHFSKAKGVALVDRNIRGLAWIVLRWAGTVRPRVIILENVEEFQTWGPVRKGKPIKSKSGQTFRRWIGQLRDLGYEVEHRELVAADYGAPTTRKRFVLIARCDGRPIAWPRRTHAPRDSEEVKNGQLLPWRSAAEIIDWSVPAYSIFATRQEIKEKYGVNAVRPLRPNTMRRIIRGVDKFTIKSGKPFLVECNHTSTKTHYDTFRGGDVDDPMRTITAAHGRSICDPVLAPVTFSNTGSSVGTPADCPVGTVRTGGGGQVLAAANLKTVDAPITVTNTSKSVGASVEDPVHTVTTTGNQIVAAANLIQYHTEQTENVRANGIAEPLPTVDASNRYGLTSAHLIEYYGNGNPIDLREPMHTVTAHDREALTAVHLQKYYGGVIGSEADKPLPTVTAIDHNAVAAAHVVKFKGEDKGQHPDDPLQTITASAGEFAAAGTIIKKYPPDSDMGHWPEVRALLNEHCGYELADDEVLTISIGGRIWYIHDIFMRMLTPRELYSAMGFPPDYIIDKDYTGADYPKSQQVARCGNAVCPAMAEAVVRANLPEWCDRKIGTMRELADVIAV